MKHFLKNLLISTSPLTTIVAVYGIAFFGVGLTARPDEYEDLQIADDLHSYFNYIANEDIASGAAVHNVIPYQVALEALDYPIGKCGADGLPGYDTRQATLPFQNDHGLPQTGQANIRTQRAVYASVLGSEETSEIVYERLLAPYQATDIQDYMAGLDHKFAWYAPIKAFLRPDVMAHSLVRGVYLYEFMDDPASEVFADCARTNQKDAFRHARMSYEFALTGGYGASEAIANNREFVNLNPAPEMLMDMYNHHVAIGIARESGLIERFQQSSQDILVQKIEEGAFALYPFPLIPKDYVVSADIDLALK